ncbi:MAG: twin-arginine translocase TatA/TatE family subunit [Acidobacteria bacterium]|nr:twin-arginine translocase TatA/TatE family subunit [Acidobacteriota bacterium]MXX85572.1 twin-arginine translocase TatA/TatE family subunit [Acidobacteriota bacterium]MYF76592.1 twin-arginine translocase TatA/TatE family subunit [Acidobacteriota bacterium]MYG74284.1 twin-arginine translocase TatA/TatE family subunit [Acidobacteriota bacterium]
MVGPFGATELLIILGIVILIFGGSRLPQLGKGLGAGIRNFRNSMKSVTNPDAGSDDDSSSDKNAD